MRSLLTLAFLFFALISHGQSTHRPVPRGTSPIPFGYYEYLPEVYYENPYDEFPLLIYFHGIDENGNGTTDLSKVLVHGPPKLIEKGVKFPFVVISPQAFVGFYKPEEVREMVNYFIDQYRIDPERVYMTGISAGGSNIWNYLNIYTDQVAAVVTISANGTGSINSACSMKNIAFWGIHGMQDQSITYQATKYVLEALQNCFPENPNIKLTLMENEGHDVWTKTYNRAYGFDIYKWMLRFRRRDIQDEEDASSTRTYHKVPRIKKITQLPMALTEISGLVYTSNNRIYAHNDSDNGPYLFEVDTTGKVLAAKKITNAANYDWEDIAVNEDNDIFIGDIGNNRNNRKEFQIYIVRNIDNQTEDRLTAERINFTLPDQKEFPPSAAKMHFDMEALIHFNDSLFVFSKDRSEPYRGLCKMYKIPATPGDHVAILADSIILENSTWIQNSITGAAMNPSKNEVALLSPAYIYLFTEFTGSNFLRGSKIKIPLTIFSQMESIDYTSDHSLIIADEEVMGVTGRNLYRINFK